MFLLGLDNANSKFFGVAPIWVIIAMLATYSLLYMSLDDFAIVDIYWSVIPFVLLQLFGLALVVAFPQIALWQPNVLFN